MEYNTQKYQFNQDGRDFVVSTGLVGNRVRITCQENLALDGPFYSNEFTLEDLRHAHQFFMIAQTPEEALMEINKGIERQKSGLAPGQNDTMSFLGYLVIGTDNDVYNLPLRRDYEPNRYGIFTPPSSGAADLVLQSNYQVDGGRLNLAEKQEGDLQRAHTFLEEELNKVIPEINKLRKISLDIKEENALIKERLKILQDQLEERKRSVFKLKEENESLKRANQELSNYIKTQENTMREKQAMQQTIKIRSRPNIMPGKSAITSKFEQSALRTFFPRTVIKPVTEDYIQNNQYISSAPTEIVNQVVVESAPAPQYQVPVQNKILQPRILPTIYQPEKILSPQIIQADNPNTTYTSKQNNFYNTQPITSNTYYTSNQINSNQNDKYGTYQPKALNPNYMSSENDVPYSSLMSRPKENVTYTSSRMAPGKNDARDIPYSSSKIRDKERNVPYSSAKISANEFRDKPYSSSKIREKENNMTYTSTRMGINSNDVPYTSSQMLNNKDKYIQENVNKPKGSRAPNYNKPKGSRAPKLTFSSRKEGNPETGYSSYKQGYDDEL